ncbi:B3 domain-containing protein Os01g0723500-like [Carex rostrata]
MAVPVVEINDVDWTEVKRPNPHFFKVLVGDFTQRMASLFIFSRCPKMVIVSTKSHMQDSSAHWASKSVQNLIRTVQIPWILFGLHTLISGWVLFPILPVYNLLFHIQKIPPNFVKNLQEDMTKKASSSSDLPSMTASIEGPAGQTWYAELEKTTTGVFFTTGWSNFARDHSLKEHELLIFRYNGCMSFTVLIFDKTACEKEDWDVGSGSGSGGRKGQLKPRKLAFGQDELGDRLKTEEKSETEDEEVNVVETSTRKRKKASERSKRDPVTEKEKLKAQEAAHSFASENPFFVLRLKASHVYSSNMTLRFPVKFSRKYLPRRKAEVILRDSANSKTWSVGYLPHVVDRDRLSRGWSSFVCDNSLEEDDYCAFELVKSAEFLVHIFRVSKGQMPAASRASKNAKA